jgi:DeoR family transcriptional regulator of aga operon
LKNTTVERRKIILEWLQKDGQVFVSKLSDHFKVSEVTIRNDLTQLESKNLLIRARGGAMVMQNTVSIDYKISEKHKINHKEKIKIGKKAASLIKDGETVILDSGTTTQEIAKNLGTHKGVNVITNAINIINQIIGFEKINLIVPGGVLRKNSLSLVGASAEDSMRNFYVDKAFIGVDGFDIEKGAYTPNIDEAYLNRVIINIAKEVILVTDSSKFKRKSFAFIGEVYKFNTIITDSGLDKSDIDILKKSNVKVIIV